MDINDININELVEKDASAEKDADEENSNEESSSKTEDSDESGAAATNDDDSDSADKEKKDDDNDDGKASKGDDAASDVDLDAQIKEQSGGRIESMASVPKLLEELDQLRDASKKEPELKFPNDRAKKAYEFLISREGEFGELTKQIHQVLALGDPSKLDPKQAQLEAFLLERKDLTRTDGEKLFNARFERRFGEMEDDNIELQDDHEQETKKAIETIQKMQDSVNVKEDAADQEQEDQKVQDSIDAAKTIDETLQKYEGLELALGKDGADKLKISLGDDAFKSFAGQLKDAMANPASIIESAIEGMKGKDGKLDWNAYADFILNMVARDQIRQKVYDQGVASGQALKLKEAKNLSLEKGGNEEQGAAKPGWFDSWEKAADKN